MIERKKKIRRSDRLGIILAATVFLFPYYLIISLVVSIVVAFVVVFEAPVWLPFWLTPWSALFVLAGLYGLTAVVGVIGVLVLRKDKKNRLIQKN